VTTKPEIRAWLRRAKLEGATHLLVVCDTFDWDDYPVPVMPGQDVRDVAKQYDRNNMQKIMECYDLSKDIEAQLAEPRARNGY
jgi:hypothetical protein